MQGTLIAGNTIGRNAGNSGRPRERRRRHPRRDTVGSTTSATIGGTGANDPNTIASNGGAGIALTAGGGFIPTGIAILRNSIYANGGLGIDLNQDGVTLNDVNVNDADPGPNGLMNYPNFAAARRDGGHARGDVRTRPRHGLVSDRVLQESFRGRPQRLRRRPGCSRAR